MTARDTYQAAVVTAKAVAVATKAVNAGVHQEAINATGVNAGANPQRGATAAQVTVSINANAAYAAAQQNAEMVKQVAIQAAKDTLRATGDLAPA